MMKVMQGNTPICESCGNFRPYAMGQAKCSKGGIKDMMPVKCGDWIKDESAYDCADLP